jgi:hypothetical protein
MDGQSIHQERTLLSSPSGGDSTLEEEKLEGNKKGTCRYTVKSF